MLYQENSIYLYEKYDDITIFKSRQVDNKALIFHIRDGQGDRNKM